MTIFLNPIAISLVVVIGVILWLQNRPLGILFSSIFLLLNLYMILAMISELSEFPSFNAKALQLLLFGSTYFGINICMSIRMLLKWTRGIVPAQ